MTRSTTHEIRPTTDYAGLQMLREGKQWRDENDEADAEMDAYLAFSEAAAAEVGVVVETETPDEAPRAHRPSNGNSSHRQDPATDKQLGFIRKLVAERGLNEADYRPVGKKQASAMIDKLLNTKPGSKAAPVTPRVRPATERQVEYVTDLWNSREHEMGDEVPDDMAFEDASAFIEFLTAQPRRSAPKTDHGIRHGHYAHRDAEGVVHFYAIGRNGKISVQAGPAYHPYNGKLNESLLAIQADPKAAAELYGQQIGRCGRCHLELTDETSRALGLGPVCAGKSEW